MKSKKHKKTMKIPKEVIKCPLNIKGNYDIYCLWNIELIHLEMCIRVITKLPNSEQSYKGKVKTHKYINRQDQSTTGKL